MIPISTQIENIAKQYGVALLEVFEFFLERASIREYEAGMPREDAERAAVGDVREWLEGRS